MSLAANKLGNRQPQELVETEHRAKTEWIFDFNSSGGQLETLQGAMDDQGSQINMIYVGKTNRQEFADAIMLT